MADYKISALTGATTPLAGTEVLPIIQGGATVKVAVSNLTAGRAVSATQLTSTIATGTAPFVVASTTNVANLNASSLNGATFAAPGAIGGTTAAAGTFTTGTFTNGTYSASIKPRAAAADGLAIGTDITSAANVLNLAGDIDGGGTGGGVNIAYYSSISATWNTALTIRNTAGNFSTLNLMTAGGNVNIGGNLVPTAAAKGFNFTANTPAAGMTSQLLNWYEEGTWAPNQGAGLTVVGAFTSNGTYVRIGRSVTVKGQVLGATTVAVAAAGVMTSNLPFTAASGHAGSMYNATIAVGGVVGVTGTSVTAATAIAASASITFTTTYQV